MQTKERPRLRWLERHQVSLLGVSQATSRCRLSLVCIFQVALPTWCLSSHLKCRLSLVCIFHLSLLGVSQATSSAAFLQSASSTSPYLRCLSEPPQVGTLEDADERKAALEVLRDFHLSLATLKPPQCRLSLVCIFQTLPTWCLSSHLKVPPFFSLHLPSLPTWCLSSHLNAAFLQSASSKGGYLVSLKPPQGADAD